ncbi:MAG: ribulose bisphosphate carboxylase small subunit [Ilumatobacteraceae bacterium]
MRLTQGMFSFLPDLTDEQIAAQLQYCIDRGWAVDIEYTDDPHPRNTYWELWGQPQFDLASTDGLMVDLTRCRAEHPGIYIRISAFDSTKGWESVRASFIVQRPLEEPGFFLSRTYGPGRSVTYALRSYATDRPQGLRYP